MRSVFFVSRCSNGLPDRFWHMGKPEEILALLWSTQTSTVSSNKLSALATRGNVGRPLTFWRYFGTNRLCLGIKITFVKKRTTHDQTVSSRDGYPFHLWDRFWPYAKLRLRRRNCTNSWLSRSCEIALCFSIRDHMHAFFIRFTCDLRAPQRFRIRADSLPAGCTLSRSKPSFWTRSPSPASCYFAPRNSTSAAREANGSPW